MTAVAGAEPGAWRDGVGIWPPGTPLATEAGMEAITGPRDIERSRRAIREAGYRGERIVALVSTDFPTGKAAGEVGTDLFRRLATAMGWRDEPQFQVTDEELWLPLSQVDSMHFDQNDDGTIVITDWIARKKGLL